MGTGSPGKPSRTWSEHVWPHMRRLLTPYSYQWIGNSPRRIRRGSGNEYIGMLAPFQRHQ